VKRLTNRLYTYFKAHKLDVLIAGVLLAIAGTVSGINANGYPQRFEDEGTYVSQAYAVQERHALAHYTYWYDHPPVGWIQIAGYTTLTDGFNRNESAISAGREFMLIIHLVVVVMVFALARRLGIGSLAAGIGTALYALSPLSVEFSRYVLLDNVALPWLLGAFLLALSPRRSLVAAIGSAFCMAIAILSKETFLALLPVLIYALWQNSDKRNRRYTFTAFSVVFLMVSAFYVLYAALKNELIPGSGHVSLIGTLAWQLFGREGSGSILDPSSGTHGLVGYWLNIDFWLLAAGIAALPISLYVRKLRVAGLSLLIGLLLLLRSGYLPYPYIIVLLPFAALTIAGGLHYLIIEPIRGNTKKASGKGPTEVLIARIGAGIAAVVIVAGSILVVAPAWQSKLSTLMTKDNDASSRQAVKWIDTNISRDKRMVVESALWTDLIDKGFDKPQPIWLYKTETDPEITKAIGGWQGIDYVILNGPTISGNSAKAFPTVYNAIDHGQIVAQFGEDNQKILVYQITK
jgi:hypothetical protein